MKVFITGVAGFLGSHLAEVCVKKILRSWVVILLLVEL